MQAPSATRGVATSPDDTLAAPHAQAVDDVLAALASSPEGLAPDEAARRLASHGPNRLPSVAGRSPLGRFLAHFNNALIYFLLAAAGALTLIYPGLISDVIGAVIALGLFLLAKQKTPKVA